MFSIKLKSMFNNAPYAAQYPAKIREAEDHHPDVALLGHKIGISNKTSFLFQFMLKTGLF